LTSAFTGSSAFADDDDGESSINAAGIYQRHQTSQTSILKAGRVVFNIKGNDYRLVARVQYQAGVVAVRFFGTHAEYDAIDAETVRWMQP
jgi:NAD(P)H-nitrite reductase large subunit